MSFLVCKACRPANAKEQFHAFACLSKTLLDSFRIEVQFHAFACLSKNLGSSFRLRQ